MSFDSVSEYLGADPNLKKARRGRPALRAVPTGDRLPPHSPEAEQGVLGCVLLSPDVMSELEEAGVAADWFYELRHGLIWTAMKELGKGGITIDTISLMQWLKDAGNLEQVGDIAYLAGLPETVPSAANFSHYLDIVREKFQLRTVITACTDAVGRSYDFEGDVPELLDIVQQGFQRIAETAAGKAEQTVAGLLPAVVDDLENYHRGGAQMRGLATGLRYVDKMLCGIGGEDNNFIVIAGRPGTGKTSLALDIVLHVSLDHPNAVAVDEAAAAALKAAGDEVNTTAEGKHWQITRGLPVAIFSLEMTDKALVKRMVFQRAQADAQRFRTGFAVAGDFPPLTRAIAELNRAQIFIDDSGRCTIDELKARARRLHRQHGIRLFVIDYIQLLRAGGRKFRDDRVQELAEISGELQSLGKELKCPFLILAQMNRDYEKEPNREPRLSDLKDCGAIEQDADVVGFLHTPKKADEDEKYLAAMESKFGNDWSKYPKPVDLLIAKARNGPTGPCHLLFQKSCMHFVDRQEWMEREAGYRPAAGEARASADDFAESAATFPPAAQQQEFD